MDRGHAEIKIKLQNGIISVIHPKANLVLAKWISAKGDWDTLWHTINTLVKKNNGVRKGT